MSQDTGSFNSKSQQIDIDDIEVSILIIAKSANRVNQAATFLNRRGWPTTVTNNLGRAIEMISDTLPDFVMVSYNHNHPALAQLPDLVVSTFNLSVIGFAEMMDTATKARMTAAKIQYRLGGQPSGPNIQRFIRKILAERYHIETSDSASAKENEKESRRELAGGIDSEKKSKSSMIFQKGDVKAGGRRSLKTITGKGQLSKDEMVKAMEKFSQALATTPSEPTFVESEASMDNQQMPEAFSDSNSGTDQDWGTDWPEDELTPMVPTANASAQSPAPDSNADPFEASLSALDVKYEEMKADARARAKPEIQTENKVQSVISPMQSVLEQAMGSMGSMVETENSIQLVERVAVFPVNSLTEPGYLVVAWDGTNSEAEFLQTCHESLKKAFAENKLKGEIESGFWVPTPRVEYWKWVKSVSKFFFALAHNQRQVGVAFFGLPKGLPRPKRSDDPEMFEIAVDQIATNRSVTFKAYLRLKENNKYYLYLRNGRQLMPEQKQRLIERNIQQFSLKTVDFENLRVFLATTYLQGTMTGALDEAA